MRRTLIALSVGLLPNCTVDSPAPTQASGPTGAGESGTEAGTEVGTTAGIDPDAPTYYEDVRPLLARHCADCHTDGGIAPFDVMTYETVKDLASVLAESVEAREMPPFNADNSGACNTFVDARWLADQEIELLRRWAEAGAPEGDASTPRPETPGLVQLAGVDIRSYKTPADYTPVPDDAGPHEDYQCFLIDPEIVDGSRYFVGFEVLPSNVSITHHLIAFQLNKTENAPLGGTNADWMRSLDGASPDQPGWDCYGAAGDNLLPDGTPATWAPGAGAVNLPAGTGIRFDPGDVLVVQMHYNLDNGSGTDQTELRVSWADAVEREAVNVLDDRFLASAFTGGVSIPPGEPAYIWQWEERLGAWSIGGLAPPFDAWGKVEVLGLLPHMHELGRRMQVTFIDAEDGSESCGIYIDRWDFHWQQAFRYEQPIVLDAADRIRVACEWDTSSRQSETRPGLGTANEMCLLGIYAAQAR